LPPARFADVRAEKLRATAPAAPLWLTSCFVDVSPAAMSISLKDEDLSSIDGILKACDKITAKEVRIAV